MNIKYCDKPKGQHEKYKDLEGSYKQLKRDICALFKRLKRIKTSMNKYMCCVDCSKHFIKRVYMLNSKSYYECPYCGKKYFLY